MSELTLRWPWACKQCCSERRCCNAAAWTSDQASLVHKWRPSLSVLRSRQRCTRNAPSSLSASATSGWTKVRPHRVLRFASFLSRYFWTSVWWHTEINITLGKCLFVIHDCLAASVGLCKVKKCTKKLDRAHPTHPPLSKLFFGKPSLTWKEHSNNNNQQLLEMYIQTEYTW